MTARSQPTPGWLAMKMLHLGAPGALSLLAAGQMHFDRTEGIAYDGQQEQDDRVAAWYENLAYSFDVVGDLKAYWSEWAKAHRWGRHAIKPLEQAFDGCSDLTRQKLSDAALMLTGVSMDAALHQADGDLLGKVFNEYVAQANRRQIAHHYSPIIDGIYGALVDANPLSLRNFTDGWCGSGVRVIGLATAMRMLGRDPHTCKWVLIDPAPLPLALCAVNVAWYDIGDDVHMSVDREYGDKWLSWHAQGRVPTTGMVPVDYISEIARS